MKKENNSKPRKGSIAFCGIGSLGLTTHDEPKEIEYPDGNKTISYIGIHLTDMFSNIGDKWSSRNPRVVGHVDDYKLV